MRWDGRREGKFELIMRRRCIGSDPHAFPEAAPKGRCKKNRISPKRGIVDDAVQSIRPELL